MSVGLDPYIKAEIVEDFQSTGNKTKTADRFNISPRTVGRVIKEYDLAMQNLIYTAIYKELNVLFTPDNYLISDTISDILVSYGFIEKGETVSDYTEDGDTIGDIIDRILKTLDDEEDDTELWSDVSTDETWVEEVESDDPIEEYEWQLVATAQSITVTRTNEEGTDSVEIAKGSDNFRKAWAIIREVDMTEEEQVNIASEEIYTMADPKLAIEKFTQGDITVDVKNEILYYKDNVIHNSLTNRIIDMTMNRGIEGGQALLNFLEKLMENPSYRAVNSLYDFLSHNDIEIASNGNFYAWKRVRSDYTDVRSGTFDNSVGATPSMPRNMVNEDPEQTCSHGLHVAAKHYLGNFCGPITLKCEVDPRDVVAIPTDYNNSKMRTCRYTVVEDVTGKFSF